MNEKQLLLELNELQVKKNLTDAEKDRMWTIEEELLELQDMTYEALEDLDWL